MDKHYRQGDVLFIKIDELPPLKFKTKKGKVILKGEVTGHAHKIKGDAKILEVAGRIANFSTRINRMQPTFSILEANSPTLTTENSQVIGYAVVDAPAELTHEEHKPITIPAGIYQIRRQKEYDEKEIRFVED